MDHVHNHSYQELLHHHWTYHEIVQVAVYLSFVIMILLEWIEHVLNSIWRFLIQFPGLALLFTSFTPPINNDFTRSQVPLNKNQGESWYKYVRASPSRTVYPSRILTKYTKGNLTNAEALLHDKGVTTLTRNNSSSREPTIVIDFGQNTAGLLQIEFAGSTNFTRGRPGLRLAYSETLQFLSDRSDFSRSYNVRLSTRICCTRSNCTIGRHNHTRHRSSTSKSVI